MALQVWLPLTKDLRNQGLSNVTVTNNGATFNSAGKLGGCYSFGTGDSYITVDPTPLKTFTEFSFACWVKIISWNTSYSTVFAAKNGTSVGWTNLIFALLRNSSNSTLCFNIADGSSHTTTTNCQTGTLSLNTWYHIVCTYKSGEIKLYQDGDVVSTFKTTVVPNFNSIVNLWIGKSNANSYQSNNLLNDVRIYDHCLSPMEVKQLSQGLVLHYNLNGENNTKVPFGYQELEYIESSGSSYFNTNYRFNPEIDGCKIIFKGNDTQNNGMIFADNGAKYFWIYYYRAGSRICLYASNGSGQQSTGYITQDLNIHTVEYKNKHFFIDGVDKNGLTNTYTEDTNTIWLFSYSNNNYPFKGRIYYTDITRNDKIQKVYIPAKRLSDSAIGMYELINDEFFISTGEAFIAGPVVATPSTIYDNSGFCNNGTINGSFIISNDTPKYKHSIYMPKTALITHSRPVFGGTDQEWTCAMWVKLDTTNQSGQAMNNFNYNNNIVHSANGVPLLYLNAGTNDYYNYGNKAVTAGEWTHIAFVFKNSNVTKLIYINGVEHTNKNGPNRTSTPAGIPDTVTVGTNLAGYISDYRVYATALSADDVKSLYQNCATIDPDGTIRGKIRI